jgi:hypothetical protein
VITPYVEQQRARSNSGFARSRLHRHPGCAKGGALAAVWQRR